MLPTVLLTGGARGIGRTIALALGEAGYKIAFSYVHSENEALDLAKRINDSGGEAIAIRADVANREDRIGLVRQTEERFGDIGILINNAGPFVRERRKFAEYQSDEIAYLLDSNLTSAMELDLLALSGMRKLGFGRIIHFGFAHAGEARAWPHRAVYAAAKVGLVSFTKTLAVEEAENGITVNMICPGDIKGDNKEKTIGQVASEIDPESSGIRPGTGEDVARVVSFLVQPESDYVSGAIIDVSGAVDPIRVRINDKNRPTNG